MLNWHIIDKNILYPTIQIFMHYMEKDIDAITATCSLLFNTRVTEGHINRLKTIKRMMY